MEVTVYSEARIASITLNAKGHGDVVHTEEVGMEVEIRTEPARK